MGNFNLSDEIINKAKKSLQNVSSSNEVSNNDSVIISNSAINKLIDESFTYNDINNLEDIEMIINDFLPHNQITMFYAPSNIGKTTSTMGLINYILSKDKEMKCFYLDYDNGVSTMKPHLVEVTKSNENFHYISADKTDRTKLDQILQELEQDDLTKVIFVYDSFQHFIDGDLSTSKTSSEIKTFFEKLKRLRKKGATTIILHHTLKSKNKDGNETEFLGLNIIKDNLDNMFFLTRQDNKTYLLSAKKRRATISPFIKINYIHENVLVTSIQPLEENDFNRALNQAKDSFFITTVQNILRLNGEMTKTDLSSKLKEDDDLSDYSFREINSKLGLYSNSFWKTKKGGEKNNIRYYSIIDTTGDLINQLQNKLNK